MGRHYAAILACIAFLVVLARGVLHGGGAAGTLELALWWMAGYAGVGFVAGSIAELVVVEEVRSRFEAEIKAREKK
jgi:hypothetical protein